MPSTGGLRSIAWPLVGMGSEKGAQIIYYFRDLNMPLYLVSAFPKGYQLKLSETEKDNMSQLVVELVESYWRDWARIAAK